MLCLVKMPLKGVVRGCALNSHGNYIIDHGKIMELFLNFCGNPVKVLEFCKIVILEKMNKSLKNIKYN